MAKKLYWLALGLVAIGLAVVVVRSIFALPVPEFDEDGGTQQPAVPSPSTQQTQRTQPNPAAALAPTWTTHVLAPFEATMPEPVRSDASSMAATLEDATLVVIQLVRAPADAGRSITLEERAIELNKAISVEFSSPEQGKPVKRTYGSWSGIEVTSTGVIEGKKRVHTAWICESGPSDVFAVVTTREADRPVSERGVAQFVASIRQSRKQEPTK